MTQPVSTRVFLPIHDVSLAALRGFLRKSYKFAFVVLRALGG